VPLAAAAAPMDTTSATAQAVAMDGAAPAPTLPDPAGMAALADLEPVQQGTLRVIMPAF